MSDAKSHSISVVIVVFAGGDAVLRALEAIEEQVAAVDGEIVCAHGGGFAVARSWRQSHPGVRWVAGGAQASPAALRVLGVRATTARIVACTEDHCVPAADWCERILSAHAEARGGVVGGAIDKATPAGAGAWAAYLLEYSRYMPPLAAGEAEYLSDCNVSYVRAALDEVGDAWRHEFHETVVHRALAERGRVPRFDPTILVRQDRIVRIVPFLRERVSHGRTFARTRTAGASLGARAALAAKSLLLPPVLLGRVVERLHARSALRRVPASAWLPLAAAAIAWSLGEATGYLTGRRERE